MYCFLWQFFFFNKCHFFLSLLSCSIVSHYLARKDTQIMRSHNRPVGHCLLCMSIILYLSGNQTEKTREPGRGTAMISGFLRKEVELGVPLHGRNLVHVFFWAPRLVCHLSTWLCFRQDSHGDQLCHQQNTARRGELVEQHTCSFHQAGSLSPVACQEMPAFDGYL